MSSVVALCMVGTLLHLHDLVLASHDDSSAEHVDLGDLGPCPDGPDSPCSDSCPCLCCPGHAKLLPPGAAPQDLAGVVPPTAVLCDRTPLHDTRFFARVFRPPRA